MRVPIIPSPQTTERSATDLDSFQPPGCLLNLLNVACLHTLRDCAIIIRRWGADKLEGGVALHKIAAKIGGAQSKITHLTEGGP